MSIRQIWQYWGWALLATLLASILVAINWVGLTAFIASVGRVGGIQISWTIFLSSFFTGVVVASFAATFLYAVDNVIAPPERFVQGLAIVGILVLAFVVLGYGQDVGQASAAVLELEEAKLESAGTNTTENGGGGEGTTPATGEEPVPAGEQFTDEQAAALEAALQSLREAAESNLWPGLLPRLPGMDGDRDETLLRFDDYSADPPDKRLWHPEKRPLDVCDQYTSSYAVLVGDPSKYLEFCTEWHVPIGATFDLTFEALTGTYWHQGLDRLVVHDPTLAARQHGNGGQEELPYLAITIVEPLFMYVEYEDGTICEAARTAVIMPNEWMRVTFTVPSDSSVFGTISIGPGGDPDSDQTVEEMTVGNDVPDPTCHPASWQPGQ